MQVDTLVGRAEFSGVDSRCQSVQSVGTLAQIPTFWAEGVDCKLASGYNSNMDRKQDIPQHRAGRWLTGQERQFAEAEVKCRARIMAGLEYEPPQEPYPVPRAEPKHDSQPEHKKRMAAEARRKLKYGLTPYQFSTLLGMQQGLCAICHVQMTHGTQGRDTACVDHDHSDGKVRGILCSNCNTGLGLFRDDPERLLNAVQYLLTSPFLETTY